VQVEEQSSPSGDWIGGEEVQDELESTLHDPLEDDGNPFATGNAQLHVCLFLYVFTRVCVRAYMWVCMCICVCDCVVVVVGEGGLDVDVHELALLCFQALAAFYSKLRHHCPPQRRTLMRSCGFLTKVGTR
jgi:hypothetical protein